MASTGKIKQIIGAVIDVQFEGSFQRSIMHWNFKKSTGETSCWKSNSISARIVYAVSPWMAPKELFAERP